MWIHSRPRFPFSKLSSKSSVSIPKLQPSSLPLLKQNFSIRQNVTRYIKLYSVGTSPVLVYLSLFVFLGVGRGVKNRWVQCRPGRVFVSYVYQCGILAPARIVAGLFGANITALSKWGWEPNDVVNGGRRKHVDGYGVSGDFLLVRPWSDHHVTPAIREPPLGENSKNHNAQRPTFTCGKELKVRADFLAAKSSTCVGRRSLYYLF